MRPAFPRFHALKTNLDNRWEREAVHILLTTPISSPPAESTSFLTPWLANLSESVQSLLPEAMSQTRSPAGAEHPQVSQKPIGTIRYVPSTGKLSRLAILKEYRQFGFGRVLVEKLEEQAVKAGRAGRTEVKDGLVTVKCHSQVSHLSAAVLGW